MTGAVEQFPVMADCYRAQGEFAEVRRLWDELRVAGPEAATMEEGRIVLQVPLYAVGSVDVPPEMFSWTGGWDEWTWQVNTLVGVNGELNQTSNGDLWVVASGGYERICLYDNAEGTALATGFDEGGNSTGPQYWGGRLIAIDNSGNPGTQLCLAL